MASRVASGHSGVDARPRHLGLYNLDEDWTQANDLAESEPDKLAPDAGDFSIEAAKNSVYPVGGGLWIVGAAPRTPYLDAVPRVELHRDITRMPEFCAPALGNRENRVTITADLPHRPTGCSTPWEEPGAV